MRSCKDLKLLRLNEVRTAGNLPNEEIQEEAALVDKLSLCVSDLAFAGYWWNVKTGPSIDKEISKGVEVTVASHYFKSTLAICAINCVDNMVSSLWFLRVANAPILDHLQLVEAFDYMEFTFIRFILLYVLEHTVVVIDRHFLRGS